MPEASISDLWIRRVYTGRGDVTLEVEVYTEGGYGRAAAPAGASRGKYEVRYLPDGGIEEALSNFEKLVAPELLGMDAAEQAAVDMRLAEIDGTEDFSRIGGAAAIATSMAVARAAATALGMPLYYHLGGALARNVPYPLGNVIGGGKHSRGLGPDVQEILVVPVGADDIYTALDINVRIHRDVLSEILKTDPSFTGGKNDEGAWTPRVSSETALKIVQSVAKAVQREVGAEVRIGVDMAASSLWDGEKYVYRNEGVARGVREQLEYVKALIDRYDLYYVEDPFHEEDFNSFAELCDMYEDRLIVGDDLFVTNAERISIGARMGAATGVIIKPDQRGTLTGAYEAARMAVSRGLTPIASHRSGDTEYELLAHVAVGFGTPIIKAGIMGGERTAKLNELLRIWDDLGRAARMARLR